eukprot:gene8642-1049_t
MYLRFIPPQTYLPEGLQETILHDKRVVAGITIQVHASASYGVLWFHGIEDGVTKIASLEGHGRPGWFRPTSKKDTFVVGLENRVCLVTITPSESVHVKQLYEIPGVDIPRIMMNDGCISPNNDIICDKITGFKDANFDVSKKLAYTRVISGKDASITTLFDHEVCANGNGFVTINEELHLVHVETASQSIKAVSLSQITEPGSEKRSFTLINFKDHSWFDQFAPGIWHEALLPDGICCWKSGQCNRIAVAVFDYRHDALRDGQVIQFAIDSKGSVLIDAIYSIPASPRVTHPAIVQRADGIFELWATTADEGLLDKISHLEVNKSNIGGCFSIPLLEYQPLHGSGAPDAYQILSDP